MTTKLRDLSKLATSPIGTATARLDRIVAGVGADHAELLAPILEAKNGFYAFESALHVFSDSGSATEAGLIAWNAADLWRNCYEDMTDGCVFFAEDVFGNQFCSRNGWICSFDAETAKIEPMARDMEEWAERILDEMDFWTGYPLAHAWQERTGAIPLASRLVPLTPFILGGDFSVENLRAGDAVEGMRFRGALAVQVRDVPDGASVRLNVTD